MTNHSKTWKFVGMALVAVAMFVLMSIWAGRYPSERKALVEITGLPWPDSCRVLSTKELVTGPFGSDFIKTMHLQLSPEDAQDWLNRPPFHGNATWETGTMSDMSFEHEIGTDQIDPSTTISHAQLLEQELGGLLVVDPVSGHVWFEYYVD